jgi:hypothetical protein
MEQAASTPRPVALFGIALATIAAGGVLGAATNAINGAVSPTYFMNILQWEYVEDLWRAAVALGIFECVIYVELFAFMLYFVV